MRAGIPVDILIVNTYYAKKDVCQNCGIDAENMTLRSQDR